MTILGRLAFRGARSIWRRDVPRFAGLALFLVAIVSKAWICDDAYITIRTADNWAHGFGPTWNPAERVQAYTHPLWFFLISAAQRLTGEFSYTTIILGLILSLATVSILAFRAASNPTAACLAIGILAASRAFTDFSTSGLEGPLVHVLLVLFVCELLVPRDRQPDTGVLAVLMGLVLMTRIDAGLLLLPTGLLLVVRRPGNLRSWIQGLLPFALWEIFSIVYYGSPIPNSALAKLNSGLGAAALVPRGLHYLLNSLIQDPVTLIAITAGCLLPLSRRSRYAAALGGGVLLYLVYVVSIGGDFMSGRFLTAPLLLATASLAHAVHDHRVSKAIVVLLAVLLFVPRFSPFMARNYGMGWDAAIDDEGVSDERTFYVMGSSLRTSRRVRPWPQPTIAGDASYLKRGDNWRRAPILVTLHRTGLLEPTWPPADTGRDPRPPYHPLVIFGAVGCMGYYLGGGVHVLDYHGIGDPLLARLPAVIPDPLLMHLMPRVGRAGWRAGHYPRRIPAGYPETLSTGVNTMRDPDLARYYERVRLVTRGPLFDASRWRALWELNTRTRPVFGSHRFGLPSPVGVGVHPNTEGP